MNNRAQQVEMAIANILNQSGLQIDVAYYMLLSLAKDLKIMWYESICESGEKVSDEKITEMEVPVTIPDPQVEQEEPKGE